MVHFLQKLYTNWVVFFLLFFVGMLVFMNVFNGSFLFDDDQLIVKNTHVHSLTYIGEYFTSSVRAGAFIETNMYRPLSTLTYAVIYHFFELNPLPYHLFNVVLHILNCFLIYHLFFVLKFKRWISLLVAMVFLVHPIQAESVSYISGQPDLLVTFFMLCALVLYARRDVLVSRYILKFVCIALLFLFSLLTKELGVIFPFLLGLIISYKWRDSYAISQKRDIQLLVLSVVMMCLYLVLKFTVLNFSATLGLSVTDASLWLRLKTFLHYFPEYIRLIFFPVKLQFYKEFMIPSGVTFRMVLSFFIILQVFFMCIQSFYKKRVVLCGFGWFFVALAPVSGIIPVNSVYMEHWLYVPLIGLLFMGAYCVGLFVERFKLVYLRTFVSVMLLVSIVLFASRLYMRNAEWAHPVDFYLSEITHNPNAGKAYNNLANILLREKKYEEALPYYLLAVKTEGTGVQYYNLGNVYFALHEIEHSINAYANSIQRSPSLIYPYKGLRNVLLQDPVYGNTVLIIDDYISTLEAGGHLDAIAVARLFETLSQEFPQN